MPRRRNETEVRLSLAVVPVHDGAFLGDVGAVFAGLATWFAVSPVPPAEIHSPIDVQRVGRASGARYVLHGWTESERDRLRLTVELNEAELGRLLWSDRLVRPLTERAALRGDAAARIGRAVPAVLLRRTLDRFALEPLETLTAQDLALRAFGAIMQPQLGMFSTAFSMLAEAARKDGPRSAVQFALVWWHLIALDQGWSGNLDAAAEASAALDRDDDRDDPGATALLAYMASVLHRDHAAASAMLGRVLDIAPLCGVAGSLNALTRCWLDDGAGAIAHAEQASSMPALGPEQAWRYHVTALAHYVAARYEDAVRWARVSATQHPGLAANVRVLAASLAVLGRLDEAQRAAAQVLVMDPAFRIGTWQEQSLLPGACRESMAQRLRLAGLPG